jgi:hypothetical protein
MRWLALLAACSPASPPAPANHADPARVRYVGTEIGFDFHEHGMRSTLHLPAGLAKVSSMSNGTYHVITARRGSDLILLVTGHEGVVTDDVTIPNAADQLELVIDCDDSAFLGLVDRGACPTAQTKAPARYAYQLGVRLTQVSPPPSCDCMTLHIDDL